MSLPLASTPSAPARPFQARTRELFRLLITDLKRVAREHGYALAVHGSLARDIDLLGVPWVPVAAPAPLLAKALQAEAQRLMRLHVDPKLWVPQGYKYRPAEDPMATRAFCDAGCPGDKPHGRLAWTFGLDSGVFIDLSIVPPLTP